MNFLSLPYLLHVFPGLPFKTISATGISRLIEVPFQDHLCYKYFHANKRLPLTIITATNQESPLYTISATCISKRTGNSLSRPSLIQLPFSTTSVTWIFSRTENCLLGPFLLHMVPGQQRLPFQYHFCYMFFPGEQRIQLQTHLSLPNYFQANREFPLRTISATCISGRTEISPFRTISVPLFPCEQRICFQNNICCICFWTNREYPPPHPTVFPDKQKRNITVPSPLHVFPGEQRIPVQYYLCYMCFQANREFLSRIFSDIYMYLQANSEPFRIIFATHNFR